MNRSILIPICLISALAGQILPRYLDGSFLTLGVAGYLAFLLLLDSLLKRKTGKRAKV